MTNQKITNYLIISLCDIYLKVGDYLFSRFLANVFNKYFILFLSVYICNTNSFKYFLVRKSTFLFIILLTFLKDCLSWNSYHQFFNVLFWLLVWLLFWLFVWFLFRFCDYIFLYMSEMKKANINVIWIFLTLWSINLKFYGKDTHH